MSKFKITNLVRSLLLENEEIKSLVCDKVYPIIAPADTVGDFLVYQREQYSKVRTNMGFFSTCRVYVDAVSDNYDNSQQLAELIDATLEGVHGDVTIQMEDSTEDFQDGKYIQVLLFNIK